VLSDMILVHDTVSDSDFRIRQKYCVLWIWQYAKSQDNIKWNMKLS